MALIYDYSSLGKAIVDFAHRSDVGTYQDYFMQGAQEAIQRDLFDLNFGNGIRFQENALAPTVIAGGTIPVPTDWLSPKTIQLVDGGGNVFPLIFKATTWLYNTYPVRQPSGLPAYISRDVMAPCVFTGSISGTTLTVAAVTSGALQAGMPLNDTSNLIAPGTTIASGAGSSWTVNISQTVALESMTAGGEVFVFGPYPDSAYSIQGTYYQLATDLSIANPSNWMVVSCPLLLHAACMREVANFIVDPDMLAMWEPQYQSRLKALVDADKAERWAASTLEVDIA